MSFYVRLFKQYCLSLASKFKQFIKQDFLIFKSWFTVIDNKKLPNFFSGNQACATPHCIPASAESSLANRPKDDAGGILPPPPNLSHCAVGGGRGVSPPLPGGSRFPLAPKLLCLKMVVTLKHLLVIVGSICVSYG